MFCTQCARFNDNNATFCDSCGNALSQPSAFSPTTSPIPVSPSIQGKPTHPWYIRWFFIIPVFFFWPSFFSPIGPMAALGFTLIRLRNVPSSSVKFGWLFSFMSLLWTSFYAYLIWGVKGKLVTWALYTLGFLLICSMACLLYGIVLAVRGRKPAQFARLLENNQLQTVEDLARALGTSDTARTKQEFNRAIKQGWLNGYDFNEATGEIRVSPFPRDVFQVCRRSLVGSGIVVLSLCMLVQFGAEITIGTRSYSSLFNKSSRSASLRPSNPFAWMYEDKTEAEREEEDEWRREFNRRADENQRQKDAADQKKREEQYEAEEQRKREAER